MSKIYEALLRAEQERRATAGSSPPETAEAIDAARNDSAVTFPNTAGQHAAPQAQSGLSEASAAQGLETPVEASSQRGALRLDSSRSSVWKPELDKLPAVEKRGKGLEQFRRLRSRLFELRDLNRIKSVMVGSGLPNEGKSFIASNLALVLARHKSSRVLLIDGDMRRGSLHTVFGCAKTPGLSDYLSGTADLSEVLQTPVSDGHPMPAGLATLTMIASGAMGDKAAELSGHPRFRELLESAASVFDWIIVDSSPVNMVTDGVNLGHACDAVLLVTRGGVTRIETAQNAMRELKATNLVGVVLNAVEGSNTSSGYPDYDSYEPASEQAGA